MNTNNVKIASIPKRVLANIIDHIILSLLNYPVALLLSETTVIQFSINMAITCYYYTHFLSTKDQASIGQKILNIYTIRCDKKKSTCH
ncbi:MAG: RDD family protein [Ehrlichia sp.]